MAVEAAAETFAQNDYGPLPRQAEVLLSIVVKFGHILKHLLTTDAVTFDFAQSDNTRVYSLIWSVLTSSSLSGRLSVMH